MSCLDVHGGGRPGRLPTEVRRQSRHHDGRCCAHGGNNRRKLAVPFLIDHGGCVMNLKGIRIKTHDMSLRDGMHPMRHQITVEQMKTIAKGLDEAGVPLIEVTHGDGLGGASVNYGFPAATDEEYLRAVIPLLRTSKVSALLIPGIGTVDHLKMAADCGVTTIRVATHCTEADVLEQATLMESYGANCLYVTDSAGYMLPDDVTARFALLRDRLRPETELGFHGHHNLSMGAANSIAAVAAGARRIDCACSGMGAGAGNTPLEVFIAVCNRLGIETGVDLFKVSDVAEDLVTPILDFPVRIDRNSLTLGYAGVYSSFLLFARRAEAKYGVSAREILLELGRRKLVGGQEDMIEDTAITMARQRGQAAQSVA